VTLLAGDPGIGKSTLLLHVLSAIQGLYIAGEESPEQVKLRAKRVGINGDTIAILAETQVETILASLKDYAFTNSGLIIVDSIQTISSLELEGMPGSVGQIRYCAEQLTTYAKAHGVALIIIGHVNKEGSIAGPKVLEHLVDTVLYLEGERFVNARILRTLKNRFGPVEEVGIFDMTEKGLVEIANPSEVFLQDRVPDVAGSIVTVVLEGTRPLLVEVQALVVSSQLAMPRRVANGVDSNRLQLIIAILQKRLGLPLGSYDIFVNISGGYKITEPSADLAIALSIISSLKNCPLISNSVAYGELGLLGEIRMVTQKDRRDKEARRVGFTPLIQTVKRSNIASIVEKAFKDKNQV
jgi:DNA repair protein RadA/Sms